MKKALIVTVGGSDTPIVQAIKSYKPDYIYFICTTGKNGASSSVTVNGNGNVCHRKKEIKCKKCGEILEKAESYPSIIKQSKYDKEYEKIEINNPDDFNEIYKKISDTIEKAKENKYEIIADFTGGTKTMSSVLTILATLDFEIKLSLTTGIRDNIIKVTYESVPSFLNVDYPRTKYILDKFDTLVCRYLYYPACLILENFIQGGTGLNQEIIDIIRKKYFQCKAFFYWDIFEYEKSFNILKNYVKDYKICFDYLCRILGKIENTGYEKVFDLISNAERQAKNGFYDNAIARVYRALELFAQILLWTKYEIDTSHLEKSPDKINPDKWKKYENEDGEIKIGLKSSYDLLSELNDEIGKVYGNNKNEFIDNIKVRNYSKLAHGDIPLDENKWDKFFSFCKKFLEQCCNEIKIKPEYPELPDRIL